MRKVRRNCTARARRSSSGASSRNAYGLALRISCENGDGSGVSMATVRIAPDSNAFEQRAQAVEIHGFVQAVVDGFVHQRMIRNANPPGEIFRAGGLVGEHGGQQIVGAHALDGRRTLCAPPRKRRMASAREAFQRQRAVNMGASSSACVSTSSTVCRLQEFEDDFERKRMLLAERDARCRYRWRRLAVRS